MYRSSLVACLLFASSAILPARAAQTGLPPPHQPALASWRPLAPLPGAGPRFTGFAETAADPGRVYATTSAGVVVSHDAGASWQLRSRYVSAAWGLAYLDASPADADLVLLAPLGDGLFRSTDGGLTFTRPAVPPADPWVWFPVFAPSAPATCYVTGGDGVYRSLDAGVSFEQVLGGLQAQGGYGWQTLVDFQDPLHVYCSALYLGLYESRDGGDHWTFKSFPGGASAPTLAIDPGDGERVLAGYSGTALFLSEDGGDSWLQIGAGLPNRILDALAFDADDPARMYASLRCGGVAISSDGGLSWTISADAGLERAGAMATGLFSSRFDPQLLLVGDAGGAFRSTDDGLAFARANAGLESAALASDVVVDPFDAQHLIAKTGGSAYASFDGGATWVESAAGAGFYGERLDCDRVAAGRLYLGGFDDRVWRSDDGGRTFQVVGQVGWSLHVTAHPTLAGCLFASGSGLKVSYDAGATFADAGVPAVFTPAFGISAADPDVMFCAGEGELYRSEDGGASWSPADVPPPAYVREIVCDPADADRAFAAVPFGGLYRTDDRGRTWQPMAASFLAADTAVILPALPHAMLQAAQLGQGVLLGNSAASPNCFMSRDGASTSRSCARGLETPILQFSAAGGVLIAGTSGSGVIALE